MISFCIIHQAIATGIETNHHLENILSGLNLFIMYKLCNTQNMILNGSIKLLKSKYLLIFHEYICLYLCHDCSIISLSRLELDIINKKSHLIRDAIAILG
jgi:hypothetical protein